MLSILLLVITSFVSCTHTSTTTTITTTTTHIQVNRLLTDTGVYICITHGEPAERLPFFEHYDLDDLHMFTPWYIEVKPIGI
jgi:hypothetical protein